MTDTLEQLSKALQQGLDYLFPAESSEKWTAHQRLAKQNDQLARLFDEGDIPAPPQTLRHRALCKLHQKVALDRKDWRLISWGLNDEVAGREPVLEDANTYQIVHQHFTNEIRYGQLPRKCWFGLANGYFGYANSMPEENPHWRQLAALLKQGFEQLSSLQRRERPWVAAIKPHLDLFGNRPGERLAKALAEGDSTSWQALQKYLPIPESSWLWGRIIAAHLEYVTSLDDAAFLEQIPTTLQLAATRPAHLDTILAAQLTRYAASRQRDLTEHRLQDLALQQWGNPQIGQRVGRWQMHVSDDVRRMVLKWFARDDLTHFFSLLQGERQVDQNRLNYWMRFVDQMAYTRVVLGTSALENRSPEFQEFKQKNKGRYSKLAGGTREDNAFIMQIGRYYFVEFSKTGNACYYYDTTQTGDGLLVDTPTLDRLKSHAGKKFNHMSGWETKTDRLLASLGIFPDPTTAAAPAKTVAPRTVSNSASARPAASFDSHADKFAPPAATPRSASRAEKEHPVVERLITEARQFVRQSRSFHRLRENDKRNVGGAFWFETELLEWDLDKQLKRLGFTYRNGRGYWIK